MKVVIIGAHEKQVRLMGDFPYLDIRCANKSAHHGAGESALYKQADRLLVMTKFISHGLFDKLDREKVIYVNGGITRARDILTTLNAVARIAKQPVTTEQEDEEDMAARERTFDFKPLRYAKVGEQFVFTKPHDLPVDGFKLAIEQGRSYYKRNYGVLSTYQVTGGGNKATVTVTGNVKGEEVAKQDVHVPAAPESFPTPTPDAAPFPGDLQERWWEVLLASMHTRPGADVTSHTAFASYAVDAFRAKFPHE